VTRRGWTLHEMLISLGVLGAVMGLAAHLASGQLRFFRDVGDKVALRGQLSHASGVAASVLWGVSPPMGDLIVALDSAVEAHMTIGTAFVCDTGTGRVIVPQPTQGNTLAAFMETPGAGDRLSAFFLDSLGATWLTFHVAESGSPGGYCAAFPEVQETRAFALREAVTLQRGAPIRFTRPVRLSLYRGSDGRWYLGVRDWNGEAERFNAVQPVAGPLMPYHSDPGRTGLRFTYRDATGVELSPLVDHARIASISIVARAQSGQTLDSVVQTVALRNAR
jgi:hypothetical protein